MPRAGEYKFTVTARLKRTEGDPVDRETIAEELRSHLEDDSMPESVYPEDSEYEVTEWIVTED
jgi:hypothetical protein